ncbi:hypothetical protein CDAR_63351 [Caerostris darwini]|uniref:Uncharacterized protein n=1 Tax=Caerostris darwini TaxID=1538125 RepID=A0AAV4QMT8_9ARAC|nr:hypothetical protein CDAR_63351 [Caerostris darwini]
MLSFPKANDFGEAFFFFPSTSSTSTLRVKSHSSFFDLLYIFHPAAGVRGRGGERSGDGTLEGTNRRGRGRWKQFFWKGRRLKAVEGSEMNGGVLKHPGRDTSFSKKEYSTDPLTSSTHKKEKTSIRTPMSS